MKYIEMFEDIKPLNRGKPTKRRYAKIRDFIKTKELAIKLDALKVPNWYVLRFIESTQYRIYFLERKINAEQKFNLFIKSLDDIVISRDKKETLLWELREFNMDVGDYIRNYTKSTITKEECEIIKKLKAERLKEREEEIKEFRKKYGDPFGKFLKSFGINDNHKTLGVERGASKDEVKKAYRNLAKQHHPDTGGSIEKFREINEAYEKIMMSFER